MSSANKNLDLIKKINVSLLTADNSNYKQTKTNEIKTSVTQSEANKLNLDEIKNSSLNVFNKLKTIINNKQDEEENLKRLELENRIKLEKELLGLSSKKKIDPNNNKISDRNLNENKVKYSRNTDFKKLSPLKITKRDKFGLEIESAVQTHKSQIMLLNRNLISGNYNIDNLNTLSNTDSNKKGSLNAVNKQIDLDAKLNLKNEFNLVKEKINNYNNIMSAGIDKNNKIEDSISDKNRTLKNLDILNYGEAATDYDNASSNVLGVNILSSTQLSLKDIKNYLRENLKTEKNSTLSNTNNNLNQIISNSNTKARSSSLITNKINKKANKRSNSFSSLDNKIDNAKSKLLNLLSSNPESDVARINASYEANSPRMKVSTIELDLIKINDPDSKRISKSSKNVIFNNTAKTKSAENKSKNSAIKISNNNIHENFFLHTNSNAGSTNHMTSGHFVNTTASNINKNNNLLFSSDEKNFVAKLKSLNNLFLNTDENNNLANAAYDSSKKLNEKIKDLNFNFVLSNKPKTIDRINNNLLTSIESCSKKAPLFDDKITYSSNTINNDMAKKISSFSNISNQAKIKLNEINSMTERLKNLGDKDKKAEDLFKNKNLFIESKTLNTEEALHKINFKHKSNEILGILNTQENLSTESHQGANFLEKLNKKKHEILTTLCSITKEKINWRSGKLVDFRERDYLAALTRAKNKDLIERMKSKIFK